MLRATFLLCFLAVLALSAPILEDNGDDFAGFSTVLKKVIEDLDITEPTISASIPLNNGKYLNIERSTKPTISAPFPFNNQEWMSTMIKSVIEDFDISATESTFYTPAPPNDQEWISTFMKTFVEDLEKTLGRAEIE